MTSTTATMDCCSLDYSTSASKITVVSAQRHEGLSEYSEDCELDGSYSEFVETQWAKGSSSRSSSDLGKESSCPVESALDVGSDTESVVVSAPLHGPTTVRCVCVCKKRGCKFVDRPYDAHSIRESPIKKVSASYRLVTWLSALTPHRSAEFHAADQIEVTSKVHPEKKSKIIQMFRSRRLRSSGNNQEEDAVKRHYPGLAAVKRSVLPERLRGCQVSFPRCIGVMIGLAFVLLGVTYDHGVKHGVDDLLQDCWSWLRTSYMNFGDEFVSYNSLFFRMSNSEVLYGEPYPKYGSGGARNASSNLTSFKDAINKVDPKFLFILEGLKLSVQVHFFSIDEHSDPESTEVIVHDRGPLFFRISFRRSAGLHVEYVPERSNMSLSSEFHIYDLMKMITVCNGMPYFGMHLHDYLKTTPSALFTMIIDNLKLFNVDTAFLSSIQAQIQKTSSVRRRIRRRADRAKRYKKATKTPIETKSSAYYLMSNVDTSFLSSIQAPIQSVSSVRRRKKRQLDGKATKMHLETTPPAYLDSPKKSDLNSTFITSRIQAQIQKTRRIRRSREKLKPRHPEVTETPLKITSLGYRGNPNLSYIHKTFNSIRTHIRRKRRIRRRSIEIMKTRHQLAMKTPLKASSGCIEDVKLSNVDRTSTSKAKQTGTFNRKPRAVEHQTRHQVATETPRKVTSPGYYTSVPVTTAKVSRTERLWNSSLSSPYAETLEKMRRSIEEPSLKKVAWMSLKEMSRKIFLPLPLDTKKTVLLPVPFIEKNFTLRYRHSVDVLGLPGYQFILGNDITRNGSTWESSFHDLYPSLSYSRVKDDADDDTSAHQRHRTNDKRKHPHYRHSKHQNSLENDVFRKSFNEVLGVVDLEPLLLQSIGKVLLMGRYLTKYPFWLSPPHFLSLTDHVENINRIKTTSTEPWNSSVVRSSLKEDSTKSNLLVGVGGVSANESLHGSFIYYHPILGVPINASLAVQVGIRPPKGMLFSHKLVPIMWIRVQVEEVPLTLWYILWAACHLRETIMITLITFGLLIIMCSLACRRKKRITHPSCA